MAKYKVMLTVKDRYGATKELDAGTIGIDRDNLTEEDIDKLKKNIPVYVPDVTPDNTLVYTLEKGKTDERLEFDIDKSNDWNEMDHTSGSSFVWEPMQ
jgi:hypothetical protein